MANAKLNRHSPALSKTSSNHSLNRLGGLQEVWLRCEPILLSIVLK
jgi:hypothetical protein